MSMPKVTFVENSGRRRTVDAERGETLRDAACRNNIALENACGGALSCATCHVIVDPRDYDRLPPPSEDEQDMLDLAFGVEPTSRLGCQITIIDGLDGLTVTVPAKFSS